MLNAETIGAFDRNHLSLEANSADDMQAWITRQHADFRISGLEEPKAGTFAKISRANVDDVALVSYQYNSAFQGEFSAECDAYFISLPISGSARRLSPHSGELLHQPDQLLVYRGLDGLRNVISSDYKHVSLTVPAAQVEAQLRAHMGSELISPLSFSPLVKLDSGAGRAVASLVNYLMLQFIHHADSFDNAILSTTMKSHLCTVLLGSLDHNYSLAMRAGSAPVAPRSVKRAEDYMRAECAEAITIEDLANVAGCSARSLHAAFKAFRGSTPMRVLRDIRLEAAHQDILHDTGTVTDIAFKYGFSNPGRFARQYAEKYGHKPSQACVLGARSPSLSTNGQPGPEFARCVSGTSSVQSEGNRL